MHYDRVVLRRSAMSLAHFVELQRMIHVCLFKSKHDSVAVFGEETRSEFGRCVYLCVSSKVALSCCLCRTRSLVYRAPSVSWKPWNGFDRFFSDLRLPCWLQFSLGHRIFHKIVYKTWRKEKCLQWKKAVWKERERRAGIWVAIMLSFGCVTFTRKVEQWKQKRNISAVVLTAWNMGCDLKWQRLLIWCVHW